MSDIEGRHISADDDMLELFQTEVETHAVTLNEGLLALENDPADFAAIESLMRAAHSIKGGARIVDLDAAVRIAHTLEDCFVTIQKERMPLSPEHIDVLLKAVDALIQIAETGEAAAGDSSRIDPLIVSIAAVTESGAGAAADSADSSALEPNADPPSSKRPQADVSEPAYEAPAAETFDAAASKVNGNPTVPAGELDDAQVFSSTDENETVEEPTRDRSGEKGRMVRVTAGKIERLMGLAGEVVVSARGLPSFQDELMALKRGHSELARTLEELQRLTSRGYGDERLQHLTLQSREKLRGCTRLLNEQVNTLDMYTSMTARLSDRLYHEVVGVRMCPFADGIRGYPRLVRDLARELGKKVRLQVFGESTDVDRDILEKLDAPLNHLLRNAVDHGIESPAQRSAAGKPETGVIRLEAVHRAGMLMITVSDDGRGIHPEDLRKRIQNQRMAQPDILRRLSEAELMEFLFLPGFSTADEITEISGRGVGLDVVHSAVHEVGGVVRTLSDPGRGLAFQLELPLTLSVIRTFLVEIAQEPYAFPLARIDRCLKLAEADIDIVEDRQYFRMDDRNIALVDIHEVLDLQKPTAAREVFNVVVISDRHHAYGLVVDRFLGESELVVRPLDPRLGKIPDINAAATMMDGSPVLIFDVEDLVHSIGKRLSGQRRLSKITAGEAPESAPSSRRILVVEDSFIVREKERKLLENRGYEVDTAVDGMDGWNHLRTESYDMVVTDIDMPRMNGFQLIRNIKEHAELKFLPVIVVSYKASEEDRLQGLRCGADYYLSKTDFDDHKLIEAVADLIGEPDADSGSGAEHPKNKIEKPGG
ncbi:MAG: hybrid sensor histidine kinase/response regulator [Thermodesulfobacteriota bacterium]